jgi:hypothetical protein
MNRGRALFGRVENAKWGREHVHALQERYVNFDLPSIGSIISWLLRLLSAIPVQNRAELYIPRSA